MKRDDNINLYTKHPEIDEENMCSSFCGDYNIKDNIYFTQTYKSILNKPILEHKYTEIHELISNISMQEIDIDIDAQTPRLNFAPTEAIKQYYTPYISDYIKTIILHSGLIASYFIATFISSTEQPPVSVIEVSFGLTNQMVKTYTNSTREKTKQGETKATRSINELDKIPKNMVPDTAPIPTPQKTPPTPTQKLKPNDLIFKEKKVISKKETKKIDEIKKKTEGQKQEKEKEKLKEKEYLKRKLEQMKDIEKEKKQGVIQAQKLNRGHKYNPNTVPLSPLSSPQNKNNLPPSPVPSGVQSAKKLTNFDGYKSYLTNQITQNWALVRGTSFPLTTKATLFIQVNQFGYLIATPKITKSSGDPNYDALIIQSTQSSFPVSVPPPNGVSIQIHVTFQMKDAK